MISIFLSVIITAVIAIFKVQENIGNEKGGE